MKRYVNHIADEHNTQAGVVASSQFRNDERDNRLVIGYATFMAAVHNAAHTGRIELLSQNYKRLAIRPLLQKLTYCLGRDKGFDMVQIDAFLRRLEIEKLLELSSEPRDTFELAYATGSVLQRYYCNPNEGRIYPILFAEYLHEAKAVFRAYTRHMEWLSRDMDLDKIMDKLARG